MDVPFWWEELDNANPGVPNEDAGVLADASSPVVDGGANSRPEVFDSNASSWAGGDATRPQWGEVSVIWASLFAE